MVTGSGGGSSGGGSGGGTSADDGGDGGREVLVVGSDAVEYTGVPRRIPRGPAQVGVTKTALRR